MKRRFHYQILLLAPAGFSFGEGFRELLRVLREKIQKKGVRFEADIDPYQRMV